MNDAVARALVDIVARYGNGVIDDSRRVEGLLRDLSGEHRREIAVLVAALREGVVSELMTLRTSTISKLQVTRLTRRLEDSLGYAHEPSRWAVETWATVLGDYVPQSAKPVLYSGGGQTSAEPSSRDGFVLADELAKLGEMHSTGLLDAQEFSAAKRKLLGLDGLATCPECSTLVPIAEVTCPGCETSLSPCEGCGRPIPVPEMKCRFCGVEYYDDEIEDDEGNPVR